MTVHEPLDADRKDLQLGDWVRVLTVPLSISTLPAESRDAFGGAVGKTFQIAGFDELGCLELDLEPKLGAGTIWLEPFCVRRTRRYKTLSKALQRRLELAQRPAPPRYVLNFEITLHAADRCEAFGLAMMEFGTGGGMAVWEEERRIKGSVTANLDEPDALERLERARDFATRSEDVESASFGAIERKA
ncbi:MAG: hypothetical protein AAF560_28125 [Acidobacteriota bacterium]